MLYLLGEDHRGIEEGRKIKQAVVWPFQSPQNMRARLAEGEETVPLLQEKGKSSRKMNELLNS